MREVKFLSPSSISKFEKDTREFYIQYLAEHRQARPPQADFMAVGSAFDAYVKSQLHEDIFGVEATKNSDYERTTIFESQVEEHVRDVARERGTDLWEQYVDSLAYQALRDEVAKSPYAPEMEFTVKDVIDGVPLLGKPDLRYVTTEGVHVICDWKVNGSTSKYGASPYPGYAICRDSYGSTTNGKPHKKFSPVQYKDVIHDLSPLEDKCDYWADQLAIYSWLLGEQVGSEDFIVRMEQIACRTVKSRDLPRAKFATHLNKISGDYQKSVLARAASCWHAIQSGHIFLDRTKEESEDLCAVIDGTLNTPIGLFPILDELRN